MEDVHTWHEGAADQVGWQCDEGRQAGNELIRRVKRLTRRAGHEQQRERRQLQNCQCE